MLRKVFLVLLTITTFVHATTVRHFEHKDFYRVVIQPNKVVHFSKTASQEAGVVILTLKGKVWGLKKPLNKKFIDSLDVLYKGNRTNLIFNLTDNVKGYRVFALSKPYRIVIDFFKTEKAKKSYIKGKTKQRFEKKVIVIDPGHGGKDTGAIMNGIVEKHMNLYIARKLKAILERDGRFKVYLTRNSDRYVSLYDRTVFAIQKNADLFISIHCNSHTDRRLSGTYIYTLSFRGATSKLARLVAQKENETVLKFVKATSKNRMVNRILAEIAINKTLTGGRKFARILHRRLSGITKVKKVGSANFAVLKTPGIPSVLIEVLYISNRYDARKLKSRWFINNFSKRVYRAIVDYFYRK
ncbi:MAG: AMIN domain-containing protein [Aquificae bacterium]|nr:AMIN domain-containing protein [Aquificota bacterium]